MDIKKKLDLYLKENLEVPKERKNFFRKAKESTCFEDAECMEETSMRCAGAASANAYMGNALSPDINTFINKELNENKFQKLLFSYIDSKGLKDSDVYNKANIDRRLFSKIRSDDNYHPSKKTIISLASSLELSIDELEELLDSASYSLPKNNTFDLIIRFCFIEKIYNIMEINNLLMDHKCSILE